MYSIYMELSEKIALLSAAAKYDASCASSGSGKADDGFGGGKGGGGRRRGASYGATLPAGVCHSWTGDGRCVSLLKVLYSNVCRFDCVYCVNRASADTRRASFTTEELVSLTC
ncbi:MAG: biotin synthase, partial [Treponema sp.]|nr:biotin synthase [Treponema sp.]